MTVSGKTPQPHLLAAPPGTTVVFELSAEDRKTLTHMFLETTGDDLLRLERGLQRGELDEVIHRVHRLYGAALTVGATALIAQLQIFEQILRGCQQIPADSAVRLGRLREALQEYRQRAEPIS